MKILIPFIDPTTNETRTVKVGWSWTLFLFGMIAGIPFFIRRVYLWGAAFAALWLLEILFKSLASDNIQMTSIYGGFFAVAIWIGKKGNEITAKYYLDRGWRFAEPDSDAVKYAQSQWNMLSTDREIPAPPFPERKT